MDWLTYKFCVLIWVLCISKSQSQLLNSTNNLTASDLLQTACEEGQPVPSPDECNSCICFAGLEYCTKLPCPEKECIIGEEIPPPDACNKCMCRRGKVACTNMICIPAPNCAEKHMYPSQNKCNACMCRNGFIRCTSNVCTEENTTGIKTTAITTTETPKKKHNCTEGSRLRGRHKCVECFCINGRKKCKNICTPTVKLENRFAETSGPECISGQRLPKPNECNNCICFEGHIHCTHTPCHTDMRIGQACSEDQPVFRPDECNECHCFEGRFHCSDLVCIRGSKCVEGQEIPKPDSCNACKCVEGHILCTNYQCPIPDPRNGLLTGSKCVEGQEIPKPDSCNACKCVEGHILCTNYQCPIPDPRNGLLTETSTIEVKPAECQDGDVIPPLPPPYECNACFCIGKNILCTMKNCVDSDPEIKGRLKEQNEQNHLQIFDKQISVEPFIEILYKNNDKIPTKVLHTHAYNGFHQEIKIHANHLPKDATKLLKALATSLDNSALASISQKLLTSSDSLSNNRDSKTPFDHQEVQNNLLGEGKMLTTQSSKLITSGSQSNETILVIPNTEPFDSENSQSVLPLTNKHETIWKTMAAPAAIVYHSNPLIQSRNSQEEDQNVNHDDRPPIFIPVQQGDMIRNTSKFSRPGRPRSLPTKPMPNTLKLPNVNTQLYSILNPKPISINDGKMSYVPFYKENNQFKPVPSGFVLKRDELPGFRPGQFITTLNNNSGQQKPSQFQFAPNLSKSYPNQVKPQEFQFKPDQNQPSQIILPTSNNKGYQYLPLFPNTPNQLIVSANQYKPSQFGLTRGQANPLNNLSKQTNQLFKQFAPNFQMIPPVINLPNQKKRISSFESEASKNIPIHSEFGPNSTPNILNPPQHGVNLEHTEQKPTHSQFIPNPSIYYKHEYEGPTIDEVSPDEQQLLPYSKLSYTPTVHYNQPHTLSELEDEANIPKVRNKTKKYNTSHSHYEKHTSITYISEYDPDDPDHLKIVGLEPNQDHNAPHTNENENYLTDQESQELDLTRSTVHYYLNVPNLQLDQKQPHSVLYHQSQTSLIPSVTEINKYRITTHQFDKYPYSPGDSENTDQNKSNQNQTFHTISIYPGYPNNLDKYPHTPSGFESKLPLHEISEFPFDPNQNQQKPAHGFQYPSNSARNPIQSRGNLHIIPQKPFDPTQNKKLPGMFDERGTVDGFQYPSHSAESPLQTKDNQHLPPQAQFLPSHNQYKGNINKQPNSPYGPTQNKYSAEDPTNPNGKLLHSPVSPTQDQDSPSFYYPFHSAENLSHPNQKQPNSPFDPTQNKLPGMFDERGTVDGFQYPSHSAESPLQTKDNQHLPPQAQFLPSHNQYKGNINKLPNSPYGSTQSKYSAEDPTNPKGKLPHSPVSPTQDQHLPSFYYPSYSAENPSHPNQKYPNSPYGPTQNRLSPEIFDERGSVDGFQYPSQSTEIFSHIKQPDSPYDPTKNQHSPGILDERGSADGFQYPSHSAEDTVNPIDNLNNPPQSQFLPSHNQYMINKKPFGSTQDQFLPLPFVKQQSSSAEDPYNPKNNIQNIPYPRLDPAQIPQKDNIHEQPEFPFGPTQIHDLPVVFDESGSADGFQYPSNSADDLSNPKNNPDSKLEPKIYNDIAENHPDQMSDLYPTTPTSNNFNNNNPVRPWMYLDHDQYKPSSFDNILNGVHNVPWSLPEDHEKVSNTITSTSQPRFEHDGDQYKPSSFDNLLNGVHDIPWSLPEDRENILSTIFSAPRPRLKPEQDQYKPSSFHNLYNGIHQIPWPLPKQDNNALGTDAENTTPHSSFKLNEDQYGPSKIENSSMSISNQTDLFDELNNELQTEQGIWAPSTEPTNSDSTQFKPHPKIKSGNNSDNVLPVEDGKIPDYYDLLYQLFIAVKKLSEPPFDDSALSGDQLDILLFLFPGIAKILNYDSEKDNDDALPVENHDFQRLYPLSKLKVKFKQLPERGNAIFNWLKSELTDPIKNNVTEVKNDIDMTKIFHLLTKLIAPNKKDNAAPQNIPLSSFETQIIDYDHVLPVENHDFQRLYPLSKLKAKFTQLPESGNAILTWLKSKLTDPIKNNVTEVKNDIDMTKIFHLLTKLTARNKKDNAVPQNIPFSSFETQLIENIMNDFQEDTLTTTSPPRTDDTHSYDNRFKPVPTEPEENRPQAPLLKYPDVHIILHQPNNDGDLDLPPYIETDGEANLVTEMNSEELVGPLFSKTFNPRFRNRPKDQKDECGHGTYWISNCHGCTCYFGQPICFKMNDCELRPFGEPMTCKPYSHFKMGCYTCECNGDGVAECDAKDCDPKPSGKSEVSETAVTPMHEFNEFYDSKEADKILQYYNHYKKLPKDCYKQDLQAQYLTCERGTNWVSSCHKCECNEHGTHECIKIDECKLNFDLYGKPGRCKPNTKFYPKTNSMPCVECSCNDEGNPYCPELIRNTESL